MFRVQVQIANNQWVDLSKAPSSAFARSLAAVQRTVSAEAAVRVVDDTQGRGERVDLVV